jgi:exonuclease VII large subunit
MPSIFWAGDVHVADYAASIRAGKTTVAVKLVVTDNRELAHLLDQLEGLKGGVRKTGPRMLAGPKD